MNQAAFQMQYMLPQGFPSANGHFDRAASDLAARLKGVDTKGANVPNSALWVKLGVHPDGADFEVKKRGQLVYVNIFCLDMRYSADLMVVVQGLYARYDHRNPKRPSIGAWIHSIPVNHELLRENELELCQKLTVAFFWAVFAKWTQKNQPLN